MIKSTASAASPVAERLDFQAERLAQAERLDFQAVIDPAARAASLDLRDGSACGRRGSAGSPANPGIGCPSRRLDHGLKVYSS